MDCWFSPKKLASSVGIWTKSREKSERFEDFIGNFGQKQPFLKQIIIKKKLSNLLTSSTQSLCGLFPHSLCSIPWFTLVSSSCLPFLLSYFIRGLRLIRPQQQLISLRSELSFLFKNLHQWSLKPFIKMI